jgi:hypothetical protein
MKVKDTYLSLVQVGDILLFKSRGLLNGDVLGEVIADLEGGRGNYTHAAIVRDLPDPEADVAEVRPNVFKVVDGSTTTVQTMREGEHADEVIMVNRLRCPMGVKLEATWPKCQEWPIDWENEAMEVWRVRNLTPENISDVIALCNDMIGWDYNLFEFLTFGVLNQAHAKICSQFVSEPVYTTTLLRGNAIGKFSIALTPDIAGNKDQELSPNDIANSGHTYKITFQGKLE